MVFSVLDRYIGITVLISIIMSLSILISLSSIVKFLEQLKKIGQGTYDIFDAGIYTLLSVPKDIQIFFPMATLLGALIGLGIMAQYNELVVMQAAGYTRIQIILSVMKTAIPLVFLIMVIGEWVAPQGEEMARNYRSKAMYGTSLLSSKKGLWVKDGKNFVYIERLKDADELIGVNIYAFDDNRHLYSIRYVKRARFCAEKKIWYLWGIDESFLGDPKQVTSVKAVSGIWKTNLTPDKLSVVGLDPDALTISRLYNYVKYLKSSGQDARSYQFRMWSKIFQPISVGVMLMLALSFIFGPLRSVLMGVRVATGTFFGFIFYILDQIFGLLVLAYNVSPIIGALFPSALFFGFSFWLLWKLS